MNEFQNKAIFEIKNLAEEMSLEFILTEEKANNFITGKLADFQIWIYSEGNADFISPNYDDRFEKFDFRSEGDLISKLISSLKDGIQNSDKYVANPVKYGVPLINRLLNFFIK